MISFTTKYTHVIKYQRVYSVCLCIHFFASKETSKGETHHYAHSKLCTQIHTQIHTSEDIIQMNYMHINNHKQTHKQNDYEARRHTSMHCTLSGFRVHGLCASMLWDKNWEFFSQLYNSKLVLSSLQDTRTLICVIKISAPFLVKLGTCIIVLIHTF